jgi:hypothetical protein
VVAVVVVVVVVVVAVVVVVVGKGVQGNGVSQVSQCRVTCKQLVVRKSIVHILPLRQQH